MRLGVWAALLGFCSSTAALAQSNGNDLPQSLSAHPGWVQAPGMLIRPDCVHEIPKGARVEAKGGTITGDVTLGGVKLAHYEPCPEAPVITRPIGGRAPNLANPPGIGNGWVESVQKYLSLYPSDNIDFIVGSWVVPPNPSASGGLLYFFNGIEPTYGQQILQPVLQWGSNGAFGGDYWVIACWIVGPGNFAFHSQPQQVSVGDTITGYTEITGEGAGVIDWQVWAVDITNPVVAWLEFPTSAQLQWSWAYAGVLEVYHLTSCSQFPGVDTEFNNTLFQNTFLYHGYPNYLSDSIAWSGTTWAYGGPSCGLAAFGWGSNPGKADLFY